MAVVYSVPHAPESLLYETAMNATADYHNNKCYRIYLIILYPNK